MRDHATYPSTFLTYLYLGVFLPVAELSGAAGSRGTFPPNLSFIEKFSVHPIQEAFFTFYVTEQHS